MKNRLLMLLCLIACGAPSGSGTTYFWNITASSIEWGNQCSDEERFRTSASALEFTTDSYLIYQVSKDGKKAVAQDCMRVDPATCHVADGGVVFDVAGKELSFSDERREKTSVGSCALLDTQQWTLTDSDPSMALTISDTMSLVDDQPSCDRIEADAKARAPNGQGFQGCIVTWTLTGARVLP